MVESPKEAVKDTARVEAFSDGVFAIAITLLILDIHVPQVKDNESLIVALAHEWTSFLALLIGFFTILICWINHHYMFQLIHRTNSVLLLLNGFKLLVVTITPFATALLSRYIQTEHERLVVTLYCFNFTLMGTAMTTLYYYACRKGFVQASSEKIVAASRRLYFFAGIYSSLICIVSLMSIVACLILFVIMFFIFLFPRQMVSWQASWI